MTATAIRKRHLISEFALLQTLSRLFHLVYFVKCIKVQEKKKKVVVLCSRPRQNVNLGTFTLYMPNSGKEMYKTSVMHVESCCFANVNLLLFCRSRLPLPTSLLKLPNRDFKIQRRNGNENVA